MVQKVKKVAKALKKLVAKTKLEVFNPETAKIGKPYVFEEIIEAKSTPKKTPRATYKIKKFRQGTLHYWTNNYFIFVGRDVDNNELCFFKVSR